MSARAELRNRIVEQLTGLTCGHNEGIYPCPGCTADAVLGLWDIVIYSTDPRIVAYTHRPKETTVADRTPAPVPPAAEFAKFAAYLDERARASMEAGTVGYPSPSAAPAEQTSELTAAGRIAKRHAEELERVKKYAFADGVAAAARPAATDIAEKIRAELVCCDIYDRLAPKRAEIQAQQPGWAEAYCELRDAIDDHDLCYWAEAAAKIAEEANHAG